MSSSRAPAQRAWPRRRVFLRVSTEELADLASLNRNYIGMIERQENAATVDTLEALAKALEVEPAKAV